MQERPSILIVDDDPDILDGILMILESKDYKLRTARDGVQCLEQLSEDASKDAILGGNPIACGKDEPLKMYQDVF